VVLISHGRWAARAERWALAGVALAPASLAAYAALWFGREQWAAWIHTQRSDQSLWLNPAFVFARNAAGLAILWAAAAWYAARRRRGWPGRLGGGLAFVFAVVLTLQAFDLVMALDVQWYSTLFGGYFFVTALYGGLAAWTAISILSGGSDVEERHDQGRLIVAFGLISTYLMFSQLLPIWYENLPQEVRFVLPRLRDSQWRPVSAALLATIYLGPLVVLLTKASKRSPAFLAAASLVLLVGLWVERWWLVTPSAGGAPAIGLPEISITAAFVAAMGFGVDRLRRAAAPPVMKGGLE
jgi:Ni/Fe-hydrogenase subunit HybB-like protein